MSSDKTYIKFWIIPSQPPSSRMKFFIIL